LGLDPIPLQTVFGAIYLALYMATGWSPWGLAVAGIAGTVVFSLNPFLRFDGYWVLADLLGVSNLGREGRRVLRQFWERLRGRSPPPLPWPGWVAPAMAVHAVLTFGVMTWMLVRMGPLLVKQMVAYPRVALRFVDAVRDPAVPLTRGDVTTIVGATFSLLLGVVIFWRLAGGATRRLFRRATQAPKGAAEPTWT
jgi:hypothetical protein